MPNALARWRMIEKEFFSQGYRRYVDPKDLSYMLTVKKSCPARCGQHLHLRGFKKGQRYRALLVCPRCGEVRYFDTMEPVKPRLP